MKRTSVLSAILTAVALVVAACGQGAGSGGIPEEAYPIVANADLAVGSQRLLVGLFSQEAESYASPDLAVEVDLYPPDAEEPTITTPGIFMWTVPDVRGLYRAQVTFDQPGMWQIALRAGDGDTTQRIPFNVAEDGITPAVGEPAPPAATPTEADVDDLTEISTDPDPDPRFYRLSLDEALASGVPTVVVFATPGFCESATCGPMLETVKQVSVDYPDMNFLHVEVYENLDASNREELELVEAVEAWQLPSEPWSFLVDSDGTVSARFEGTVTADELRSAIEELS